MISIDYGAFYRVHTRAARQPLHTDCLLIDKQRALFVERRPFRSKLFVQCTLYGSSAELAINEFARNQFEFQLAN